MEITKIDGTEYLNTLRVLATIAVVILHTLVNPSMQNLNYYTPPQLCIVKFLRNFFVWCVPVFVMISGVLFLNPQKEISLELLLRKYILRILLALLCYGTFFSILELIFNNHSFSFVYIPKAILNTLMGKSWDHLWYLYMLIGIYLLLPVFKLFVNSATDKQVYYLLVILFIFASILPSLKREFSFSYPTIIPVSSVYVFYLFLGYAVHYRKLYLPNVLSIILILVFIMFCIVTQAFNWFSIPHSLDLRFCDYASPIVAICSLGVFSLFRNLQWKNNVANKLVPFCFGIYIFHPFFINLCTKLFHITLPDYSLITSSLIIFIAGFFGSLFLVFILRKIPFFKKIV